MNIFRRIPQAFRYLFTGHITDDALDARIENRLKTRRYRAKKKAAKRKPRKATTILTKENDGRTN